MDQGTQNQNPNEGLRRAALAARERSRVLRESMGNPSALAGLVKARRPPTPEHFHLIYHVPSENLAIPYYSEIFATAREAYERMHQMGLESEPNTEWYDEGMVGIETRVHSRAGLWWILLEPARCIRSACRPLMTKDFRRRQLVLVKNELVVPYIRG